MQVVFGEAVLAQVLDSVDVLVVAVLDAGDFIFDSKGELPDIPDDGRSKPPHAVHIGEAVLGEEEAGSRSDVSIAAIEVFDGTEVPDIATEEDPLGLLAVCEAYPGG